ncbi:MAG: NUDIX domain-containing protein [Candidatus Pseudobacter hemicellulosilyticus]|uniref:NUDIX domain-containing protein n=1 Tax=Candidatus Pseudobacter hemicellulosilyticus TaxID=3121375 RepID=A0AAJ5WKK6_9BACT|nr:MAG: NUDIX domain-containing protein [Pseudobacter sp.]
MINVRVYGILMNDNKDVLVADELIKGKFYTKFPGGGLEFGEGTRDCLKREFQEEMNLEVTIGEHLYTTDYYQPSAFNPAHQFLAIYYKVHPVEPVILPVRTLPFFNDVAELEDVFTRTGAIEAFRYIPFEQFSEESVSLPTDKILAKLLKAQ